MVDFEQIGDTFEEGFEKVKNFSKKNKVFAIALVGVGGFALYKMFTNKSSQDTEYTATYAYVPTGYDGYPEAPESVDYDAVVEQLTGETVDVNNAFYDEIMSDVTKVIEDMRYENEKMYSNIVETSKNDSSISFDTSLSYIEEQRIKEQMQANSEAWHTASESEKKILEEQNQTLGSLLGASFDSVSGTWSKDGESLYNVTVKNNTNTSTANLTNVGVTETTTSKTDIVNQMKANSEAWHTASESERKALEAENQRLGAQLGASFDSSTGTWSNSNGSSLYTVSSGSSSGSSSKSSSSSSSSSKTNTTTTTTTTSSSSSSGSYDNTKMPEWLNTKTALQGR